MSNDPYKKVCDELIGPTGETFRQEVAWIITQGLHRKAIFHYDPLSVKLLIEKDEDGDHPDDCVVMEITAEKLGATWQSQPEVFDLKPGLTEQDIRDAINRSIDYLVDTFASEIDVAMPDKPWTIGIDAATAAWCKTKLSREKTIKVLETLSSNGHTVFPDPPTGKVSSQGYKITGGAALRMVGMIATSSIDLGQDVNYRNGIITVPGALAATIQAQLMGGDASQVIDHPLMTGAGTVRMIFDNTDSAKPDEVIETSIVLDRKIIDIDRFMAEIGEQEPTEFEEHELS